MSTVSPIQGPNGGSGAGHTYSQSHQSHHSSAPSHHHVHSHHSSSQDGGGASGLPHTSFDSIASHHGHQQSSQAAPQQSQQSLPPPQQPHGSHAATNGSQWGPAQSAHYGGSGAGAYSSQHGVYNPSGYYSSPSGAHGNSTSSFGGGSGYSAYSVQPHQNYSMYGNHASQGGAANAASAGANGSAHHGGSAHHSGNSTPTSTTPYAHPHHSSGGMFPSQGYPQHHYQSGGGYYGSSGVHNGAQASNGMMSSSPSYTSAPQYSTQLPLAGRHRVTTTLWEDEGTLCFQVDARGVCVARRHDNNMINGTKLLNVCGMSRGKRDGILKNEKERIVVKVGAMHLKGVWITFHRGKQLAEQNDILDVLYPLFETNIQSFLYHPDNYPRTAAVIAAAQERHAQRSRVSVGTQSPTGYPAPQRSSSHTGPISNPQQNPPPLMRSNTTPSGQLLSAGAPQPGYHHSNGYSSAPNHSQQHSPYAQSHSVSSTREMPGSDSRTGQIMAGDGELAHDAYTAASPKLLASYKPAPLHSSHLSNSTYAFPATGGGPVKYQQRSTLGDRDEASMQKATESISQAYPSWGNRGNAFQTQ